MGDKRFYTIRELEEAVNRTAATLYAFMRSNDEVKQFFKDHRQERSKGGYVYDEEALNRLKNQYMVENAVPVGENENETAENPNITPPVNDEAATSAELEEIRGRFAALQADFEEANKEIALLRRENALKNDEIARLNGDIDYLKGLINLEKQEKAQLYLRLPPPRQSIGEKLKSIFKKNKE